MELRHLGDDYDLIKRYLMALLAPDGDWAIVPMFTDEWLPADIESYERLLGGRVLTPELLGPDTDRQEYFRVAADAGHVFIDPNTGVKVKRMRGVEAPKYVFVEELCELVRERSDHLTLVYDQSIANGADATRVEEDKLDILGESGVQGIAYAAPVSFLILSRKQDLIAQARQRLGESGIPPRRIACLTRR